MAAVILRAEWNDYDSDDLETVELIKDDEGEVMIFSDGRKADEWLEVSKNHETGYSYHITEI
jgi:hypothetical protein